MGFPLGLWFRDGKPVAHAALGTQRPLLANRLSQAAQHQIRSSFFHKPKPQYSGLIAVLALGLAVLKFGYSVSKEFTISSLVKTLVLELWSL